MENNNTVTNTEPQQSRQPLSKKIGNILRATHYKLGVDGNYSFLYNKFILI